MIRYHEVDLERMITTVKSYFEGRGALIVVVFGSVLRRVHVRDVDIAVKFSGDVPLDELLLMGAELEGVLGTPVDLVPLDDAPPWLRLEALAGGLPILVKDQSLYAELLKQAMGDAQDMDIKLAQATHAETQR